MENICRLPLQQMRSFEVEAAMEMRWGWMWVNTNIKVLLSMTLVPGNMKLSCLNSSTRMVSLTHSCAYYQLHIRTGYDNWMWHLNGQVIFLRTTFAEKLWVNVKTIDKNIFSCSFCDLGFGFWETRQSIFF